MWLNWRHCDISSRAQSEVQSRDGSPWNIVLHVGLSWGGLIFLGVTITYKQHWRKKHNYRLSCSWNGSLLHEDNAPRQTVWGRGLTGVSRQLLLQTALTPLYEGGHPLSTQNLGPDAEGKAHRQALGNRGPLIFKCPNVYQLTFPFTAVWEARCIQ